MAGWSAQIIKSRICDSVFASILLTHPCEDLPKYSRFALERISCFSLYFLCLAFLSFVVPLGTQPSKTLWEKYFSTSSFISPHKNEAKGSELQCIMWFCLCLYGANTQWLKNLSGEIFIQVATLEGGIPGASIFCIWIFVYSEDQSMLSRRHSRNNVRSRSPVAHKNDFLDLLAVIAIFRRLSLSQQVEWGGKSRLSPSSHCQQEDVPFVGPPTMITAIVFPSGYGAIGASPPL